LDQYIVDGLTKILESGYTGKDRLCENYGTGGRLVVYSLDGGKLIEREIRSGAPDERDIITPDKIYFRDDRERLKAARTVERILTPNYPLGQARFDIDGGNDFYVIDP